MSLSHRKYSVNVMIYRLIKPRVYTSVSSVNIITILWHCRFPLYKNKIWYKDVTVLRCVLLTLVNITIEYVLKHFNSNSQCVSKFEENTCVILKGKTLSSIKENSAKLMHFQFMYFFKCDTPLGYVQMSLFYISNLFIITE